MFKKINMIIIAFFASLTVLMDIGFVLYIPVIFFYLLRDNKNIYYLVPTGFIALFSCTGLSYLIPYGILMILILLILWIMSKISKSYCIYGFIILLNIIMQVIIYRFDFAYLRFGILLGLSLLLYFYFEKNLLDALKLKSSFYNSTYTEIVIGIIAILGGLEVKILDINLGYVLSIYLAMFGAVSWKNIYAMLYALIVMIIEIAFYNLPEAMFLPFVVAFYFLPFVYPIIVINTFAVAIIILDKNYSDILLLIIMGVSVIFELFKNFITKEYLKDEVIREQVYTQIASNVSTEVLSFAAFLDHFAEGFKTPKEYNEKISEALKTIVQRHCIKCPNKKECFNKNRGNIYIYFRNLLLQKDLYTKEMRNFLGECSSSKELNLTTLNLNKRINFNISGSNNNALIAQITGVASAIRQYAIEIVSKNELSYETITNFKQHLVNYGYAVEYFEIKKSFIDDFLIILGISDIKYQDELEHLKIIADSYLDKKVTINLDSYEDKVTYLKIIPEVKLDILYGYGSLSSEGSNICGDNYIIKNLNNGKFISAISDGMGKGYSAFYESNMTLKLVSDVIELSLDSTTSLQILNIFYVIQDYLERYATLDLLEINRYTKEARFYKMGGTTSYIIKDNGTIDRIMNKNLPFGIDEDIENYCYSLDNGDLILMSSDGIFENIMENQKLESFINSIKEETPQKIVYEILNYTINNDLKTNDDMTLIALKIKAA